MAVVITNNLWVWVWAAVPVVEDLVDLEDIMEGVLAAVVDSVGPEVVVDSVDREVVVGTVGLVAVEALADQEEVVVVVVDDGKQELVL